MMRILPGMVIIFFAVAFFLFSENEVSLNDYYNNIAAVTGKIQLKDDTETGGYGISPEGTVTMDDDYFGYLYYEIEKNPPLYASKEVVVTGFVHKEPGFGDNEFKVARIQLPKCGSEENQILGLMCITEKAADFNNDEWVTVKGTLIVESYINPMTNSERYKYYIVPENIEKIQRDSDYTI